MSRVCTPSMIYSGELLLIVVVPRTKVLVFIPPGVPSVVILIPATLPCRADITLPVGISATSFIFTTATEPVRLAFFSDIYPVTTTSSSTSVSSCSNIFIMLVALIVCGLNPTKDTTILLFAPTVILKFPSISVIVPLFELFSSTTVAPITGKLSDADRTVPFTVICCAETAQQIAAKSIRENSLFKSNIFIYLKISCYYSLFHTIWHQDTQWHFVSFFLYCLDMDYPRYFDSIHMLQHLLQCIYHLWFL